ncbi:MAG: AI-2E family transporter, partial [Candidatus Xenobia bacterium]
FLSLVGVPYSVLLAVLAGLFEFVPLLGPLSAAAMIFGVALFSGFPHLVWLVIFLIAYRLFEDYVLSPFLMSSGAEVSPLLVIVGVLAGEHIAGVPGMILSIPVVAALRILVIRLREERALEVAPPLEG